MPPEISLPYNVKAFSSSGDDDHEDFAFFDKLFESTNPTNNHFAKGYQHELSSAERLNFTSIVYGKGDEFKALVMSTIQFKWVYTVYGKMHAGPTTLTHAVVAGGAPAFTAGEGAWFYLEGNKKPMLVLANHSGHYRPTDSNFDVHGVQQWGIIARKFKIRFHTMKTDNGKVDNWLAQLTRHEDKKLQESYYKKYYKEVPTTDGLRKKRVHK